MRCFRVTGNKDAEAILKEGFRDGTHFHLTDWEWSGVWISNKSFDDAHLFDVITFLVIEISSEDISDLEWLEEGEAYPDWLVLESLSTSTARRC